MNWFQKKLTKAIPLKNAALTYRGRQYKINFIDPAVMELNQSFGHIVGKDIYIRSDLPKSVERFVIHHEIYHLNDTHTWLGWIGKETRANVVCGISDPIGIIATIKASLTKSRLKAYWNTLLHRGIRQV